MDGCAFVAAITGRISSFDRGMFIVVSQARGDVAPLLKNFDQTFGRAGRLHLEDPGGDR